MVCVLYIWLNYANKLNLMSTGFSICICSVFSGLLSIMYEFGLCVFLCFTCVFAIMKSTNLFASHFCVTSIKPPLCMFPICFINCPLDKQKDQDKQNIIYWYYKIIVFFFFRNLYYMHFFVHPKEDGLSRIGSIILY